MTQDPGTILVAVIILAHTPRIHTPKLQQKWEGISQDSSEPLPGCAQPQRRFTRELQGARDAAAGEWGTWALRRRGAPRAVVALLLWHYARAAAPGPVAPAAPARSPSSCKARVQRGAGHHLYRVTSDEWVKCTRESRGFQSPLHFLCFGPEFLPHPPALST